MIEEWDLTATSQRRIRARRYEVAVLPIGATEAHNLHLPEGTDWRLATYIARESCRRAWERCHGVICLPALPFSSDCNLLDFPLTIHVSQATVDAMVTDVVRSLRHHGIRKVLLLNGHGGNHFMPLVRELQSETDVHVFLCNWWSVGSDRYAEIFDKPDDHAGEMESSAALAVFPELVELEHAASGQAAPYSLEALRRGWVRTSRRFSRLNDHCGVGEPHAATAEKGRRYLDLTSARIADFLVELATAGVDEPFPHVAPGSDEKRRGRVR
jgi:creatinine amidohydrolase